MNETAVQSDRMKELMTEAEEKGLTDQPLALLHMKHHVINKVLKWAAENKHPGKPEAERQARLINAALVARIKRDREERGEPEPEPITVELKSISMGVIVPKLNR